MRYTKTLMLLAVAAAALMAFTTSASATTVTPTTGGTAQTLTPHAENEGGYVTLANAIANIECFSTIEGTVTSHGSGVTASVTLGALGLFNCTNGWTVEVQWAGSLELHYTSGHNGTVTSSGATFTAIRHTIFGTIECRYVTSSTHIGTVTGGNPATLHLEGAIPFHGGSGLCGTGPSQLSGDYVTTSALYVAP